MRRGGAEELVRFEVVDEGGGLRAGEVEDAEVGEGGGGRSGLDEGFDVALNLQRRRLSALNLFMKTDVVLSRAKPGGESERV